MCAKQLTAVACSYNHMQHMAERPDATDAFLDLVETIGLVTNDCLVTIGQELARLLAEHPLAKKESS
jgi:hypothetical protein